MGNDLQKSELAKKLILKYLRSLHEKMKLGEPLSTEEKHSIASATNLVSAIYEYGKDQIYEGGIDKDTEKKYKKKGLRGISRPTISNAIRALHGDGLIEKKDDGFHYAIPPEELFGLYPILKLAPQITITPLPVDSVAFYRVDKQYAALITEYINGQVYTDDIHAVNLGDTIMCMDLQLPKASKSVAKKYSLQERMSKILKRFNLQKIKKFDDSFGVSEEEWERLEDKKAEKAARVAEEAAIEAYNEEKQHEKELGGQITSPSKRRFKKKSTTDASPQEIESKTANSDQ